MNFTPHQCHRRVQPWAPGLGLQKAKGLNSILANVLIGILIGFSLSACSSQSGARARVRTAGLTEEDRHRLYAAALEASEFPLESETFRKVCRKIGIFDDHGNQNDKYLGFVSAHLEWAMKAETDAFKREINTREKAGDYINKHLP
jgi:hypothetical protein